MKQLNRVHTERLTNARAGVPATLSNGWDQPVGAHTDIRGADDQVMGFYVINLSLLVRLNPFILIVPFRRWASRANGSFRSIEEDRAD